jgi:alpha-D-xyloside xylohydrolase
MKFTDGRWMLRPGVQAFHPVEVLDVETGEGTLTVRATVVPVRHRGDLLKGPMITLTLSAPAPDVIAVNITHLTGQVHRPPAFALEAENTGTARSFREDEWAVLTSGALTARVRTGGGWRLEFLAGGRVLTASDAGAAAIVTTAAGADQPSGHYIREQLNLGVGGAVYGLGERFGPLVKNGQVVDIWNADGGTGSEQAYKNVPFCVTNAGFGVFVNDPGRVSFEVASEAVDRLQFSVPGQSLEYMVIYGPEPKDVLRNYTALTGRPPALPAWSYGLWLSTSFTTSYDEATVTSFIEGMSERGLPLSVFHFDTFWMREFHWCDFEWDPRTFPDPAGMLARLKARDLRICVWINPYIAQQSALFDEGKAQGYLLRRRDGDVWQTDMWQPGMAVVDFTNPAARDWYASKLDGLLAMGVDCFKSDFGERIPFDDDIEYFDGSDPVRMRNYYTYLYNQTVFELLRKRRGDGEAVLFARSATAGSQRFPVHWGGDCDATFEAMAQMLRGGLSLGMSGFGYWSHDIGGFEGTPDAAVYKRWIAFGLLSSHSRLHGSGSYRVPWLFDEEAVDVLRTFTKLKMRLMPYLLGAAGQVTAHGIPIMRAMALAFPRDPNCTYLDRQYMLGDDLLVAPVLAADGEVSYYVPDGAWTHFLTGERVTGPRWVTERHGFLSVPLYARPGAVIPVGAVDDRPDYDYANGVTLRLYEIPDGARVTTILSPGGQEFVTTRTGDVIRVEASPATSAPEGNWQVWHAGRTVRPEAGVAEFTVP